VPLDNIRHSRNPERNAPQSKTPRNLYPFPIGRQTAIGAFMHFPPFGSVEILIPYLFEMD
jgi:hypothetical protein